MVSGLVPDLFGIFNICPIFKVLAFTLFKLASSVTDTPNWLLIPYKVSPDTIFM